MRVAVVLPRTNIYCAERPNSIETVVRTLLAESRYRRNVTVICDAGAAHPADAQVITLPPGLSRRRRTAAAAAALRSLQPDVVEHHQQLRSAADLARRHPGASHVFYRHTSLKAARGRLDSLRYRRRLSPFDRLVFVSQAAAAEFNGDYPGYEGRVAAICNPIDAGPWAADAGAKEPLILFSGRAMPEKGLDLVCAALVEVLDVAPHWRAELMLGDWDIHKAWAAPHIETLRRFGERVTLTFSAPLSEVRAATQRAAIALTPSRVREALGLSALEAHAAGAALISSGRGGLREASGAHARFVEPGCPNALVAAIVELIEDPAARIALARAGQAHVLNTHSPIARAADLDDLRAELFGSQVRWETPRRALRSSPFTDLAARPVST